MKYCSHETQPPQTNVISRSSERSELASARSTFQIIEHATCGRLNGMVMLLMPPEETDGGPLFDKETRRKPLAFAADAAGMGLKAALVLTIPMAVLVVPRGSAPVAFQVDQWHAFHAAGPRRQVAVKGLLRFELDGHWNCANAIAARTAEMAIGIGLARMEIHLE